MRTSIENKRNQWRKVNEMESMQELLEQCTMSVRDKENNIYGLVLPYGEIVIEDEGVLEFYMRYRVELLKLKGLMRNAIANEDLMELALLRKDTQRLTKKFYNTLRKITGESCVLGINHDEQNLLERGLVVYMFPVLADETHYDLKAVLFEHKVTGEEKEFTCLTIPYEGGKNR